MLVLVVLCSFLRTLSWCTVAMLVVFSKTLGSKLIRSDPEQSAFFFKKVGSLPKLTDEVYAD